MKVFGFEIKSCMAFLTSQGEPSKSRPVKRMICAIYFVGTRKVFNSVKSLVRIYWSASSTFSFFSIPSSSRGSSNSTTKLASSSYSSFGSVAPLVINFFDIPLPAFFFLLNKAAAAASLALAFSSFSALSRFLVLILASIYASSSSF